MVTVALKESTYDLLTQVKKDIKTATYDETIRKLVLLVKKPRQSYFGRLKGVSEKFKREELDRFD